MLEFNHDFTPPKKDAKEFGEAIIAYLRSGDPQQLPDGVTWFGMRHHTTGCPLGNPPRGWLNEK